MEPKSHTRSGKRAPAPNGARDPRISHLTLAPADTSGDSTRVQTLGALVRDFKDEVVMAGAATSRRELCAEFARDLVQRGVPAATGIQMIAAITLPYFPPGEWTGHWYEALGEEHWGGKFRVNAMYLVGVRAIALELRRARKRDGNALRRSREAVARECAGRLPESVFRAVFEDVSGLLRPWGYIEWLPRDWGLVTVEANRGT